MNLISVRKRGYHHAPQKDCRRGRTHDLLEPETVYQWHRCHASNQTSFYEFPYRQERPHSR